jgi:hypothetical protein
LAQAQALFCKLKSELSFSTDPCHEALISDVNVLLFWESEVTFFWTRSPVGSIMDKVSELSQRLRVINPPDERMAQILLC